MCISQFMVERFTMPCVWGGGIPIHIASMPLGMTHFRLHSFHFKSVSCANYNMERSCLSLAVFPLMTCFYQKSEGGFYHINHNKFFSYNHLDVFLITAQVKTAVAKTVIPLSPQESVFFSFWIQRVFKIEERY